MLNEISASKRENNSYYINPMPENNRLCTPGEVLVLLTPLHDLEAGMYVVHSMMDNWVILRTVIDNEAMETLNVTNKEITLPVNVLELFMPVGINLSRPT
jgi:hypothetical protein